MTPRLTPRPLIASAIRTTQPSTLNYTLLLMVAITLCVILTHSL